MLSVLGLVITAAFRELLLRETWGVYRAKHGKELEGKRRKEECMETMNLGDRRG